MVAVWWADPLSDWPRGLGVLTIDLSSARQLFPLVLTGRAVTS
jgi:hypothetical protein